MSLPGRLYIALVPYLCAAIILIGRGEGDATELLRTPISPREFRSCSEIIVSALKSRVDFSDSAIAYAKRLNGLMT